MRNVINSWLLRSLVVAVGLLCWQGTAVAQVSFSDVSKEAGVDGFSYTNSNGHSLGLNWIDYDNDLKPDIFLVNGFDDVAHLYHNEGGGVFSVADGLLPVLPNVVMTASVFADYDNDGDSDIYIFTDNETWNGLQDPNPPDGPPNLLLKNLWMESGQRIPVGEPLFEEVADEANLGDLPQVPLGDYPGLRAFTGGWLDYDRDGWVDLYVGHLVPQDIGEISNFNRLYRNLGDGTFEEVTASAGLDPGDGSTNRPTLAFIGAHLDSDLWPDMYVANVLHPIPDNYDLLFNNAGDGSFTDTTGFSPGIGDDAAAAMGVDVGDLDLNGTWDIYISDLLLSGNEDGNTLYLGNPDGTFQDNSSEEAGVYGENSWGVNFFDADQDGYEDLFMGTMSHQGDVLYLNDGDGTFTTESADVGLTTPTNSRGTAVADYDGDGDLDVGVLDAPDAFILYRNDTAGAGNWLQIKLKGTTSNADAIGALVEAEIQEPTIGQAKLMRQVKGGSSGHGQDSLIVHFGLGGAPDVESLTISWPSGIVQVLPNVPVNQLFVQVEPEPLVATRVVPRQFQRGWIARISVKGSGFEPGLTVSVCDGAIPVDQVTVVSGEALHFRVKVPMQAERGTCSLRFTNPDGQQLTMARGVIVR